MIDSKFNERDALLSLEEFLVKNNISYSKDFDLSTICHIKAGGMSQLFISPDSVDRFERLLREVIERNLKYIVVGRLSNTLFRSGIIRTIIISTTKLKAFEFDVQGVLYADAGVSLPKLAKKLTEKGYAGFGGLSGFPASVGGAVYMNASCYGNSISDFLVDIKCLNATGDIVRVSKREAGFQWRYSNFHDSLKDYVILGVTLKPKLGDGVSGKKHLILTHKNRVNFQERKHPNLGSTFATVDIYGDIAKANKIYRFFYIFIRLFSKFFGRRRDKVWASVINKFTQGYFGLKERNGIGFSDKTMNCIVNKAGAEADDIIDFVYDVKRKIGNVVDVEIKIYDKIL